MSQALSLEDGKPGICILSPRKLLVRLLVADLEFLGPDMLAVILFICYKVFKSRAKKWIVVYGHYNTKPR